MFGPCDSEPLLQLSELGLGLLINGDVGVGVVPEGEKVLIRCSSFHLT